MSVDDFEAEKILNQVDETLPLSSINLLRRLVRVQQQRIQELTARIVFLERDALNGQRDHEHRRQELANLQSHYADLNRRYDLLMQRTR